MRRRFPQKRCQVHRFHAWWNIRSPSGDIILMNYAHYHVSHTPPRSAVPRISLHCSGRLVSCREPFRELVLSDRQWRQTSPHGWIRLELAHQLFGRRLPATGYFCSRLTPRLARRLDYTRAPPCLSTVSSYPTACTYNKQRQASLLFHGPTSRQWCVKIPTKIRKHGPLFC